MLSETHITQNSVHSLVHTLSQSSNQLALSPSLNTPIPVCISYYIQVKAQHHKSYLGTIQYRLAGISSYFAAYTVRDLSVSPEARNNINGFIQSRLQKVKAGTVRKDASTLQSMMNWLRRDIGLQIPDIFKQIRLPKDYGTRSFVPNDEQVHAVIANLPSDELKHAALLLSETACRRNEILKLRICDCHVDKRYVQLLDTKNGSDRRVPLSGAAMSIIKQRLELIEGRSDTYPLFSILPEFLSKQFRKAADKEGLSSFVLHTLRHYRLSKLMAAGHDAVIVSKLSGHKDHRMLNRYVKVDTEDLASILFD